MGFEYNRTINVSSDVTDELPNETINKTADDTQSATMRELKTQKMIHHLKTINCSWTDHEGIVDDLNKICFMWSPRAGCTITCSCIFDMLTIYEDAVDYYAFIHLYRAEIFHQHAPYKPLNTLIEQNYMIIKSVLNPYARAVSIWRLQMSHDLSFRDYLRDLIGGRSDYLTAVDIYHLRPQYVKGEESYVTKYIKLDLNEKYVVKLANGSDYEIDINKYSSPHHAVRTETYHFVGDVKRSEIYPIVPKSYRWFYDDEIQAMVEKYYGDDIRIYGYSLDQL